MNLKNHIHELLALIPITVAALATWYGVTKRRKMEEEEQRKKEEEDKKK